MLLLLYLLCGLRFSFFFLSYLSTAFFCRSIQVMFNEDPAWFFFYIVKNTHTQLGFASFVFELLCWYDTRLLSPGPQFLLLTWVGKQDFFFKSYASFVPDLDARKLCCKNVFRYVFIYCVYGLLTLEFVLYIHRTYLQFIQLKTMCAIFSYFHCVFTSAIHFIVDLAFHVVDDKGITFSFGNIDSCH